MANDYYQVKEPGEPINWDATPRLEEEKFVFPETKDEYPLEDPASEFPDLNAHENIDTLQVLNALKNIGVDIDSSLTQDAPDRLPDEPTLLRNMMDWILRKQQRKSPIHGRYEDRDDPNWNEYMHQRQYSEDYPGGGTYGDHSYPFDALKFKDRYGPFQSYQTGEKVEKHQNANESGMISGLNRNKKYEDILRKYVDGYNARQEWSTNW